MALVQALYCPVCYGMYVDDKHIKTGKPISDACKQAGEIKGFPDTPIKNGLLLRGKNHSSDKLHLIVIRSEPDTVINEDIGRVFFEFMHKTYTEPGYSGISIGGKRDGIEDYGAGIDQIPLRRLWGGHGFYSRATRKDLDELVKIVREHKLPGGDDTKSWNSAVPIEDLHIEPNPFF